MFGRLASFGFGLSLVVGCDTADPGWCEERLSLAREASSAGRLEQAVDALDEVRTRCKSQYVTEAAALRTGLSKVRREQRVQLARQVEEKERRQRSELPAVDFLHWALGHRRSITPDLGPARCFERGQPGFGFCDAERPGAPHMRVRYWEREPEVFRYTLDSPLPLTCEDLGEHLVRRRWARAGIEYVLCEMTGRERRHLSALIERRPGLSESMHLFSRRYPKRDPEFELRLRARAPRR